MVYHYESQPAICALCRSPRTPGIDTGVDFDHGAGFWRLYVCQLCVEEMARLFDMVPAERAATLEASLATATEEARRANQQLASLKDTMESLYGLVRSDEAERRQKKAVEMAKRNTRRAVIRELKELSA